VEKIALAQRIVTLIARTRARLEIDLQKVGILQGDVVVDPNSALYGSNMVGREISSSFLSREASLASSGGLGGYGTRGNNPAAQISQSLRNALGSGGGDPDMPPQKSRCRYVIRNIGLTMHPSRTSIGRAAIVTQITQLAREFAGTYDYSGRGVIGELCTLSAWSAGPRASKPSYSGSTCSGRRRHGCGG
jgi:hypothetical protein